MLGRDSALIKLAQGAFVSPARLETIFEESPIIERAFVHAESQWHNIAGLFVLDLYCILMHVPCIFWNVATFCKREDASDEQVRQEIDRLHSKHQLKAFEYVRNCLFYSCKKICFQKKILTKKKIFSQIELLSIMMKQHGKGIIYSTFLISKF